MKHWWLWFVIIANQLWCKHMVYQYYRFGHHTKWKPERLCFSIYSTSAIRCFQERAILGDEVLLWCSSNWHRLMLKPFGTWTEKKKNLMEILSKFYRILRTIPCFPDCVISAELLSNIHKHIQWYIQTIWNSMESFSRPLKIFPWMFCVFQNMPSQVMPRVDDPQPD